MLCGIIYTSQKQQQRERGQLDLPETQVGVEEVGCEPAQPASRAAPPPPGESASPRLKAQHQLPQGKTFQKWSHVELIFTLQS